ncbi:MAG: hypothetical protein AAF802_14295 [Planctomycetota bacterium]
MSEFDRRLPNGWRLVSPYDESLPGTSPSVPAEDSPNRSIEEQDKPLAVRTSNLRPAEFEPRWKRELDQITGNSPVKTRTVPLQNLVSLLIHAERFNRTWLKDFAEDTVTINSDLHDVLLAYAKMQADLDENEKAA